MLGRRSNLFPLFCIANNNHHLLTIPLARQLALPIKNNNKNSTMSNQTIGSGLGLVKAVVSCGLLIFSVAMIFGLMADGQTRISGDVHPALAFVVLIGAITWLTMVEGGQGSLVGLAPVNGELFKETHPKAYVSTKLAHSGDNLDRYLLGRQFMVVLTVFSVNMSAGPNADAELWGLPDWVINMFLGSGLAMILLTCMVGQLNSQVNGCSCMLDYINNYFAIFTLYVAMAIEFSGLLHASYIIQILVAQMAGKPIESNEPPRDGLTAAFFWARCLMSLGILGFCLAATLDALFAGKTTIWEQIPAGVSVVLFFVLMCVVGLLEGMQIAFFAVARIPADERGNSIFAKKTCELLFKGRGENLAGFMIGRQLCVVSCMFVVARVTTIEIDDGEENIFGVSDGLQEFFNFGFLGAIFLTIAGSISWQLVASAFPLQFLANPLVYVFLRICLGLEATGLCQGAWVLAALHKKIAGFKRDEVYIGTAEERRAKQMGDNEDFIRSGPGHPIKLPAFPAMTGLENYSIDQITALEADLVEHLAEAEEKLRNIQHQKSILTGGKQLDAEP
jgi:silicon transporter